MLPKLMRRPAPPKIQIVPVSGETIDPRVKRTRQLIVDAYCDLMSEKSFAELTVRDIAQRAGINRATFYAHFLDKYALLDFVISQSFQQVLYARLSPVSEPTGQALRELIMITVEFFGQLEPMQNSSECKQVEPLLEAEIQKQLKTFLMAWFKKSQKFDSARLELLSNSFSWSIFGSALEWSRGERKLTAEEVTEGLLTLFRDGTGLHTLL